MKIYLLNKYKYTIAHRDFSDIFTQVTPQNINYPKLSFLYPMV